MSLQSQMLLFDQDPQLWIYKILVFRIKIISCEGHFNRETKIFLSASYQIKSAFINSGFLWNFIYYVGRIIWWQTLKNIYILLFHTGVYILMDICLWSQHSYSVLSLIKCFFHQQFLQCYGNNQPFCYEAVCVTNRTSCACYWSRAVEMTDLCKRCAEAQTASAIQDYHLTQSLKNQ